MRKKINVKTKVIEKNEKEVKEKKRGTKTRKYTRQT